MNIRALFICFALILNGNIVNALELGQDGTVIGSEVDAKVLSRTETAASLADSSEPDNETAIVNSALSIVEGAQLEEQDQNQSGEGVLDSFKVDVTPTVVNESSLLRLAVVGVKNETREKEFSNLLIAQGVSQLVAQALFDSGHYVPVEDNPEITGRINDLMALAATARHDTFDYSTFDRHSLGCDAMATATIKKFSKSRVRSFLGPFSSAEVNIEIVVEVSLRIGDKPLMAAAGSGHGVTKSKGFLFQVREDKVHFDQTSVGQATQTAVEQAVSLLLAKSEEEAG